MGPLKHQCFVEISLFNTFYPSHQRLHGPYLGLWSNWFRLSHKEYPSMTSLTRCVFSSPWPSDCESHNYGPLLASQNGLPQQLMGTAGSLSFSLSQEQERGSPSGTSDGSCYLIQQILTPSLPSAGPQRIHGSHIYICSSPVSPSKDR